jgi:uncharacterized membrane protein YvlD (DUF360 family)
VLQLFVGLISHITFVSVTSVFVTGFNISGLGNAVAGSILVMLFSSMTEKQLDALLGFFSGLLHSKAPERSR